MKKGIFSSYNIATTAILLALVILLQTLFSGLHIGIVSLSFVLVPIVLGGLVVGVGCGTFLGLMFGIITIVMGLTGADLFTNALLNANPVATIIICLLKGTLTGLVPALLFKLKREYFGVMTAAMIAPIINTGVFFVGILFIRDTIEMCVGSTIGAFILTTILFNFSVEFLINIILAPSLYRVFKAVKPKNNDNNA